MQEVRLTDHAGERLAAHAGGKIANHAGERLAAHAGDKIANHAGERLAGPIMVDIFLKPHSKH